MILTPNMAVYNGKSDFTGVKNSSFKFVLDLNYTNVVNEEMWMDKLIGCNSWEPTNHMLFQLANVAVLVGLCAPDTTYGALFLHIFFVFGFLLLSIWSWVILCAPDFFSWNFAFMLINGVQTLFLMYRIRPVKFCEELEDVYSSTFEPLRVPRSVFKKLVSPEYCTLMNLHEGEAYATQSITKTDKLGILISGQMNVYSNRNLLHTIRSKQFIDSPEFESSVSGDEKFQVSVIAASMCRYIFWPRRSLEYLLVKEPYLANIMNTMLGRDITNKLYALNQKVSTPAGSRLDIRLPSVSSSIKARQDIRKAVAGVASEPEAHGGEGEPKMTMMMLMMMTTMMMMISVKRWSY
ncbi:blood vessel epicardial substance-like [Haliotis rubra]|uniref:blood vessel epicardial substance-like n=1 Tax=Haliotis rubra TaxID=36100 RepID=UPI001EE5E5EA|nr:blood vessel epicardial substance-like [Haliotis rubra]